MKSFTPIARFRRVLFNGAIAIALLMPQPLYAQTPKPPRNITNSQVSGERIDGDPAAIRTSPISTEAKRKEIAHIDCGRDDERFGLFGNAGDIGRVHADRTYIQAADKTATDFAGKYFGYRFDSAKPRPVVIRFYDADNVTRQYNVVVNDTYVYAVDHFGQTAQQSVNGWKEYFLLIPLAQLHSGSNTIAFESARRGAFPPAIADIWIYQIGE